MEFKTEKIVEPVGEIIAIQEKAFSEVSAFLPKSQVELVGAMAVPMVGRPELDLLVLSEDIEEDSSILVNHGYSQGPVIDGTSFLRKMVGEIEVTVQIMSPNSKMVEIHRNIIELLRADEVLKKEYEDFKRTLSGLSREEYKKKKSAWIEKNIKPRLG